MAMLVITRGYLAIPHGLDPNLSEFFLVQSLVSSSMFLELFLELAEPRKTGGGLMTLKS